MLIDDNKIDNFFHERVIKKYKAARSIILMESGQEALDHLTATDGREQPDVIFLDINMPGMTGWEFIDNYKLLGDKVSDAMIVVMLTTSENPDDKARAQTQGILANFRSKPLTKEMLEEVMEIYYASHTQ